MAFMLVVLMCGRLSCRTAGTGAHKKQSRQYKAQHRIENENVGGATPARTYYVRAAGRLEAVSRIAFSTDCGTCSKLNGSIE